MALMAIKSGVPAICRHTWFITSTLSNLHYIHLTLYCSPCHSPGLSSQSVSSDAQLLLNGTHYLHSSWTAAVWQPVMG